MRRLSHYLLAGVCAVGLFVTPIEPLRAQTGETRARAAVESLHRWLGEAERGRGWREYLRSDELERQLAQGSAADRGTLREILAQYRSGRPGLERPRFAAVRAALQAWLEELPRLSEQQLAAAAREAREQFSPLTDADVRQARQQLHQAGAEADRLMARWTPANRAYWQDYLDWEQLKEQSALEQPDLRTLESIGVNFYRNEPGLELPQFIAVREALVRYVNVARFAANPRAGEFYQKHLDELAQRLEAYAAEPRAEDRVVIGQIVGWMERYDQAEELVAAVRQHHSHPNLLLYLSEEMLRIGVDRQLNERMTVREVILGTTIRANSHLRGQVTLALVPDPHRASLDLVLQGTVHSNNTGVNGPVKIFSTSVTPVSGRKRVVVDADGIESLRAQASARTRSRIQRIAAHSHVVQSIAWHRARQSQSQVEAIASGRAGRRLAGQMDAEIGELLAPPRTRFAEGFRAPLLRRDAFPRLLNFSTSSERLFVTALQAAADQLGAPGTPPALADRHDVAVRMHESLVGNFSQAMLGGLTLTDEELQDILERLLGEVPEQFRITPDDDPWTITFAAERPVHARFDDQQVTVAIRATHFSRAEQTVRENIEVAATYSVERTSTGVRLTRDGEVRVVFEDRPRLRVGDIAVRTFLRTNFQELFREQFETDGIDLPGRWEYAGKMVLQQLDSADGWLALGWRQPRAVPEGAELVQRD